MALPVPAPYQCSSKTALQEQLGAVDLLVEEDTILRSPVLPVGDGTVGPDRYRPLPRGPSPRRPRGSPSSSHDCPCGSVFFFFWTLVAVEVVLGDSDVFEDTTASTKASQLVSYWTWRPDTWIRSHVAAGHFADSVGDSTGRRTGHYSRRKTVQVRMRDSSVLARAERQVCGGGFGEMGLGIHHHR